MKASRRNLDNQLMQIQRCEPSVWPNHLREALEIVVERHKSLDEAKAILVESVKAAHDCAQGISQIKLSNSRNSTSDEFHTSCVRIANCLKPTRSPKEMRNALNDVARRTFVGRDVNTESISDFFCECHETLKKRVQDNNSAEILKYLGHVKCSQLGHNKYGPPILAIVRWYESLPTKLMLNSKFKLRQVIEERQLQLTASDVFQALSNVKLEQDGPDAEVMVKDPRVAYVQKIAEVWKRAGLNVGRTTNVYEPVKLGPFPTFVERVLLSQFDLKYNFFQRPDDEKVWDAYEALPEELQEASSANTQPSSRLITDRLLRQALKASSKKVEQTSIMIGCPTGAGCPHTPEVELGLKRSPKNEKARTQPGD